MESEEDFRRFLENNHQYWDYVDTELEERFHGVSRLKFYLTDDGEGQRMLRELLARFPAVQNRTVEDSDWENNWRDYYRPIAASAPAVTPRRGSAFRRWRTGPRRASGCWTSAAAAAYSGSGL